MANFKYKLLINIILALICLLAGIFFVWYVFLMGMVPVKIIGHTKLLVTKEAISSIKKSYEIINDRSELMIFCNKTNYKISDIPGNERNDVMWIYTNLKVKHATYQYSANHLFIASEDKSANEKSRFIICIKRVKIDFLKFTDG